GLERGPREIATRRCKQSNGRGHHIAYVAALSGRSRSAECPTAERKRRVPSLRHSKRCSHSECHQHLLPYAGEISKERKKAGIWRSDGEIYQGGGATSVCDVDR